MSTELVSMTSASVKEYFRSGNVAQLKEAEKDFVLAKLCEKYNLDPILRPFDLIDFRGVQKFYMTASATNQLANAKSLSRTVESLEIDPVSMLAKCIVKVSEPSTGRVEMSHGFISLSKFQAPTKEELASKKFEPKRVMLEGDDLANALLKLETKTKRRATLSFFGVMDAGSDYEDRPIPQVYDPTVPRATVMQDAANAVLALGQQQEHQEEVEVVAQEPKPAPAKKEKAPKKEKVVQATNDAPEIEAGLAKNVTLEQASSPAKKMVIYSRGAHAVQLVASAELIWGKGWNSDVAKKEALKAAIPQLDGKVEVMEEGSEVACPEFVSTLKKILGVK